MLVQVSKSEISEICSIDVSAISDHRRDEMAIPSYLHTNGLIRWLVWQRHDKIEKLGNFQKDMSVLDFGCGVGIFLPTLCQQSGAVYACDLFPQYAKALCRKRALDVTFVETIDVLPDSSLDVIVAAEVLEHIDNLRQLIAKFHAKLTPRGRLLVSAPTEGFVYKIGRIIAGFGDKHEYHKSNAAAIRRIIIDNRFDLYKADSLPFRLPPYLYRIYAFQKVP